MEKKIHERQLNRLPPQNIEAEESILASILIDNKEMAKISGIIKAEDFYKTAHQKIFSVMIEIFEKGDLIDLVTLAEELKKKNILDQVGGAHYIAKIIDNIPISPNIRGFAKIIKEKALRRALISGGNDLMNQAFDDEMPINELLPKISELQSKIYSMVPGDEDATKFEINIEKFLSGGFIVETPFKSLNRLIEGIVPGELLIIGGRTGMGKTALVLQLMEHVAIVQKEPVLYCGAHMSRERIYLRLLAERCQVSFRKLFARRPPKEKHAALIEDHAIINGANIHEFIIKEKIELPNLWAQVKNILSKVDLKIIIIENLQQLSWPGKEFKNGEEQASFMIEKIRPFEIETGLPIAVSSQLNRDVEDRDNKRPMPSDIFGKKAEELSDIIIFPFRPNYYEQRDIKENGRPEIDAELIISKGASPTILPFTFWGDYLRWEER